MLLQVRRWFELSNAVSYCTSKIFVCRWKYAAKGMLQSLRSSEYIKITFLGYDSPFLQDTCNFKAMVWNSAVKAARCPTSLAWHSQLSHFLSWGDTTSPSFLITWAADFHACLGPGLELGAGRKENWQKIRVRKENKVGKLSVHLPFS